MTGQSDHSKIGEFGSTNPLANSADLIVLFTYTLHKKVNVLMPFEVNSKIFTGMIDTGAYVSIACTQYWPHNWTLQKISYGLQEISSMPILSERKKF